EPGPATGPPNPDQAVPLPAGTLARPLARFELAGRKRPGEAEPPLAQLLEADAEVYEALKLGLGDYVRKNGFERVLVAVSGGIDSALVALIAADALGAKRVSGVVMPSPHSS